MGKSKYRENNRLEIASSLLLSFTLFFFGPLEILLSSPLEFWFSASDVIGLFLISTLLCFSATMGLQYLAAFSRGGQNMLSGYGSGWILLLHTRELDVC